MKYLVIALLVLTGCYVCPTNGTPEPRGKYAAYRDAACEVVPGCDPAFMERVRVYEAPREELPGICNQNQDVLGCYCGEMDCLTIVFDPRYIDQGTILHEYIHAAMDSAALSSGDHSVEFWEYWRAAQAILDGML